MSYFVKLETARGERTIWGVDLERALKESLTQPAPGDEVGLRTVRQEPVKVKAPARDAEGNVLGERELDALRNRWIIEKRGFFEARAEAARTVRDAERRSEAGREEPSRACRDVSPGACRRACREALARSRGSEALRRQVRSALADAVARGEPLPPVRLREPAPKRGPGGSANESRPAPVRG